MAKKDKNQKNVSGKNLFPDYKMVLTKYAGPTLWKCECGEVHYDREGVDFRWQCIKCGRYMAWRAMTPQEYRKHYG